MQLTIDDDIVSALKAPEPKVEEVLRRSVAISLYAQRLLSLGKACQLSHMSLWEFETLLTREKISRDYTQEELEEDFAFANRPRP